MPKRIPSKSKLSTTYYVDYSDLPDGPLKRGQAIAEVKRYLGESTWTKVQFALLATYPKQPTLEQLQFQMMFVGVQGYPVRAIHETLWEKK